MKSARKILIAFVIVLFVGMVVPNIVPKLNSAISVEAASVKMNDTKKTLYEKETYRLKMIGTKKKVKWSSSKKSVATVSSNGKVTAKKKGKTTITAKIGSKKYKCNITVKSAEINKKTMTLYRENSYRLKILGATTKVKWYTSNKSIASVATEKVVTDRGKIINVGTVTAKKKGTVIITAKMGNKKYKCKVTVKNPYMKKTKLNFYPDEEYSLCVYGRTSDKWKPKAKWTSSNKKVATVNNKGIVKAQSAGTTKITAIYEKEKYTCIVTIKSYIENDKTKEAIKIATELLNHTNNIDKSAKLGDWENLQNWSGYKRILDYKNDFEAKYTKSFIKNYWYKAEDKIYIKSIKGKKYLYYPRNNGILEYIGEELKVKKITDNTVVFNSIGYYFKNVNDYDKYISTGNIRESLEEGKIKYYTKTSEFVIKMEDRAWKVDKYKSLKD